MASHYCDGALFVHVGQFWVHTNAVNMCSLKSSPQVNYHSIPHWLSNSEQLFAFFMHSVAYSIL
jgi:hypothetical protein